MKLRLLIVEDEPQQREYLRSLLQGDPEVEILGECASGGEAVTRIAEERPDLVLLDVRLPVLDGFGVLEALDAEVRPAVIFVTSFDEYAVRAFDEHAVDYLLKPFDAPRLHRALRRARERLRARRGIRISSDRLSSLLAEVRERPRFRERFIANVHGREIVVPAPTIDWIEAEGNYARLHVGKKTFLIRETMHGLEAALDAETFVRVHRSAIVNVRHVTEIVHVSGPHWFVVLEVGQRVKVGPNYRAQVRRYLGRASA